MCESVCVCGAISWRRDCAGLTGLIEKRNAAEPRQRRRHSRPRKAAIVHPDAAELVALAAAASKAAALRAVGLLRGVLPLVGLRDDRGGVRFSGERA